MKAILLGFIAFYRNWISPLYPASCRFRPTCSQYSAAAIRRFGVVRGVWMGLRRIGRCHPFADGGFDPLIEE